MRRFLVILAVVPLLFAGIGLFRHAALREAKAEAGRLGQAGVKVGSKMPRSDGGDGVEVRVRETSDGVVDASEAKASLARVLELMEESSRSPDTGIADEIFRIQSGLRAILRDIDQETFRECLGLIESDPRLTDDYRQQVLWLFLGSLPADKAMDLIQKTPGLEEKNFLIGAIFREWCRKFPGAAVKWYEEEEKKGNPAIGSPGMEESLILAQARVNPDRALKLAMEDGNFDEGNLGGFFPDQVSDEKEHGRFLAALRRAEAGSPGDPVLKWIRSRYLGNLSSHLCEWTFADASGLIDGELSAAEKRDAAANLASNNGVLQEPEQWAGWFQQQGDDLSPHSPVRIFLMTWLQADYLTAGKWLDRYPEGEAKQQMTVSYARHIVHADPEEVRRRMLRMPQGDYRSKVEQMLREEER